jgi:hypothetical protein
MESAVVKTAFSINGVLVQLLHKLPSGITVYVDKEAKDKECRSKESQFADSCWRLYFVSDEDGSLLFTQLILVANNQGAGFVEDVLFY